MPTVRAAVPLLFLVSGLAAAAPAEGMAPQPPYGWVASVEGHHSDFSPSTPTAERDDLTVSLRRHFRRGSIALEHLGARSEERSGQALAADAYARLWPAAYANFRWQEKTEGDLFADTAHRIELYQGLPGGWEPAVSWDRLNFGSSDTDLYGLALGRYLGNFYLRARAVEIPSADTRTYRAQARWYYLGDGDTYLEAALGSGRSAEDLAEGRPAVDTRSAQLAWVWYFRPRLGLKTSADWTEERGGAGVRETGVGAALYARW